VVLSPAFGVTSSEVADKVRGGSISAASTLVVDGEGVILEGLTLDGALIVRAAAGATVHIKGLSVQNRGWEFVALADGAGSAEEGGVTEDLAIRGYQLVKHEERVLNFTEPGHYEVTE
jgi:UDP-sugar pyrophosphorylase